MSAIPESFYVDVNINYQQSTQLTGRVPISVLISSTATTTKLYDNLQQVASDYTLGTEPEYLAAQIYFNNGGSQLLIFQQGSGVSDTAAIESLLTSYSDFIWVTFAQDKEQSDLEDISEALSAGTQRLPKFLAQTAATTIDTAALIQGGYTNMALLYDTGSSITPYSALIIPAYFSQINLDIADSLQSIVFNQVVGVSAANVTTSTLETIYSQNWNVVVNLGNRYTILDGGKMLSGEPIHSAWAFCLLKKDCEDVVIDLLVNKLPYANSSNVVIENALSQVCNRYVINGLIGTNKTYNQSTQIVEYNGATYTLITQGTVLNLGYAIYSIPISRASQSDIDVGRIPPIYIYAIIDDVIRLVVINGEVSK